MDSSFFRHRGQVEANGMPNFCCTHREDGVLLLHRRQQKKVVFGCNQLCQTTFDQGHGGALERSMFQADRIEQAPELERLQEAWSR